MNDRLAGDPGGAARPSEGATALQKSIARIHNACKAPPLSPPDYQVLFETMAGEINANGINGPQTVANIAARSKDATGVQFQREDIRFVLEVVSEPDPWFDQGASANIFAGRFRNFVVARCRAKGLTLSAEELELIEAWFAGPAAGGRPTNGEQRGLGHPNHDSAMQAGRSAAGSAPNGRWWNLGDGQSERGPAPTASYDTGAQSSDEFPRIVRRGLRG